MLVPTADQISSHYLFFNLKLWNVKVGKLDVEDPFSQIRSHFSAMIHI